MMQSMPVPERPQPGADLNCPPASRDGNASRAMVVPLARGLAVLAAFDSQCTWLRNHDVARRTGLAPATVSRLVHSLVILGYLRQDTERRRYRLTAATLSLGYAAIADAAVQSAAHGHMQRLADTYDACVVLGTRDRLDVVILETRAARQIPFDLRLAAGMRQRIACSAMGWALLATLPERERTYLQGSMESKADRHWPALRRGMAEGISQVSGPGYCVGRCEWNPGLVSVAVPVRAVGRPALALACIGPATQLGRARIEREVGPRLVNVALALQERL
ncbi:IclR family transcriptional regulator [Cupriavidus numazuensis]|uniref:HTH-type transcriptional regulator TsaQ1/TsaQ2 n=1 Tax=Cupriavidus numazuensis TaxID=221992 RepID=A0ABN7PWZ8_9BURK|nr:IclR family transcriptional regulator [Cupriavidus numazuensis]CAG2144930.1 HTH-type transcriptional regulator TsaQ1/TsaQ2 [Cupriavidus numazuensis]